MAGDWFQWSEKSYSLQDIIANFEFPLIVKVQGGYCGETALESMSANEILRFHCHDSHTRVIAKSPEGKRMYSIPATYPEKFREVAEKGQGPPRKLQELINTTRKPFTVSPLKSSFTNSNGETARVINLAKLSVVDEYEEHYVKANGITDASLNKEVSVIPCYVKAQMVIAEGLSNRSQQQWQQYMEQINRLTPDINYSECLPNQDIMQYSVQMVEDAGNVYATVEPSAYLSLTRSTQPEQPYTGLSTPSTTTGEYAEIQTSEQARRQSSASATTNEYDNLISETTKLDTGTKKSKKKEGFKLKLPLPKHLKRRKSTPTIASSTSSQGPDDAATSQDVQPAYEAIGLPSPGADTRAAEFQKELAKSISRGTKPPKPEVKPKPKPKSFSSLSDVPQDIGGLSLDQVSACLHLLSLGKYADALKEHHTDGEMLKAITTDMLLESYGMQQLEAVRLVKFAAGWRPT